MAPTRQALAIGGLVVALVIGPMLLAACVFAGSLFYAGATFGDSGPFTQADAERMIGSTFPATTTGFDGYREGFQDGFYECRFEIEPGDEPAFFARTKFANETGTRDTDNPFDDRADPTEPEPIEAHGATSYEWFTRQVPGANETLMFDRSDPSKTVVLWRRLEF